MNRFQSTRLQQLFEFLTFWGGEANCGDIAEKTGLKRETVQRQICDPVINRPRHPGGLSYNRHAHRYVFPEDATTKALRLSPRNARAVVAGAEAERLWAEARGGEPFFDLPVEDALAPVAFGFHEERFQPFVAGILRRKAIALDYLSKTGPMFATFSPHTVVRTSYRVHVRGYAYWRDGMDNRFIDIIPGRVMEAKVDPRADYVGVRNDAAWQERVGLRVTLRPEIPAAIRDAMEREYGAFRGEFVIEGVRRAMADYVTEALESRRVRGYEGGLWTVRQIDGGGSGGGS